MTDTTAAPEQETKVDREEQKATLMPALTKMMPALMAQGAMYHKAYPVKETLPEVIDAVTVSVPLRHFMVMVAYCSAVVAQELEAKAAAVPASA